MLLIYCFQQKKNILHILRITCIVIVFKSIPSNIFEDVILKNLLNKSSKYV